MRTEPVGIGNPLRLDLQEIIAASRTETGLSNIGESEMFDGMGILIDALVHEAKLHANGIEAQRTSLIGFLSNRLRIEDTFRRHPEILNEEIHGPIIIIGLPRSGTTKLQRMIAASPDLQKLPYWKILNPVPLAPVTPEAPDTRIAYAEQVSAAMRCNPSYVANVPSFDTWLAAQDFGTWYVFLKKLLQLFQWQDGSSKKNWLLKTPEHMSHIEDLFKVFPNATIVHCHRDPAVSVASLAELTIAIRRLYSAHEDHHDVGRFTLERWSQNMNAYLQQRSRLGKNHRFIDISFKLIATNAMAQIETIHQAAGVELRDEARAAMLAWEAGNPPGKHGEFHYQLQNVGLDEAKVHAAFADYLDRFGALT